MNIIFLKNWEHFGAPSFCDMAKGRGDGRAKEGGRGNFSRGDDAIRQEAEASLLRPNSKPVCSSSRVLNIGPVSVIWTLPPSTVVRERFPAQMSTTYSKISATRSCTSYISTVSESGET